MRRFLAPMGSRRGRRSRVLRLPGRCPLRRLTFSAGAHSATAPAADPTFPPPRCIPENQTDGTFQSVYLETRTLSGNGKSVKVCHRSAPAHDI
jgi:hypothetical protein